MARERNPNLEALMLTVDRLGGLADQMVFLGGSATGLLITDPAAPPIRETRDIDAIVQVGSLADYYRLSQKLRMQGFKEDVSEGAPVCRWLSAGVILDVMPTDETILGFGNCWYAEAMAKAEVYRLPSGRAIYLVTAPYFLITKLTAFEGRGHGDYHMSHDMEDIIAVIDGRPNIVDEVSKAKPRLRKELSMRFQRLLEDARFLDAVPGHMPTDAAS